MAHSSTYEVHPTASVSSRAQLGIGVRIGPYAVIGDRVAIGEETIVGPHAVIEGPTSIGKRNRIIGQSSIGTVPQDLKFRGEESFVLIGDENTIREFVTINRGTGSGGGKTVIGNRNLLMTGVHIAHDCRVGDDTILANSATLAGHVEIADYATVGAFTGIHQFCRIGPYGFIGGYSVITRDALPFVKTVGSRNQAKIYGINALGLKRQNFSAQRIDALKRAYRWLFAKGLKVSEAVEKIREEGLETQDVADLIQFIESARRGFIRRTSRLEEEG